MEDSHYKSAVLSNTDRAAVMSLLRVNPIKQAIKNATNFLMCKKYSDKDARQIVYELIEEL